MKEYYQCNIIIYIRVWRGGKRASGGCGTWGT